GAADAEFQDADLDLLATFASSVPACQCALWRSTHEEGEALPRPPSRALGHSFPIALPPVWLTPDGTPAVPLLAAGQPDRVGDLQMLRSLRDAETSLQLLVSAIQGDLQLAAGKMRYVESLRQTGAQADDGRLRSTQEG